MKIYFKKIILTLVSLALFFGLSLASSFDSVRVAIAQSVPVLDQWIATSSPSTGLTQRVFGRSVRVTGVSGCVQADSNGYLTGTGSVCGSGSSSGTVTSVATNNGLTGGTITTTGTLGLDTSLFSTNALLTWNGSKLAATGTPALTAGYFIGTTTSTSTLGGALTVGAGQGTSTFASGLSATNLNLTGSVATNTASQGINITSGCFSISGTCLSSSSGSAYPFALTGNATSTKTQFNGGLTAFASSTIGAGGQTTGLTISGGATTTGNALFNGSLQVNKSMGIGQAPDTSNNERLSVFGTDDVGNGSTDTFHGFTGTTGDVYFNYDNSTSCTTLCDTALVYLPASSASYGIYSDGTNYLGTISGDGSNISGLNSNNISNGLLQVISSARVGIGSTTPYGLLSINPTSALGTRPSFVIGSSTATKFIVDKAGNVGIGTANPSTKLNVVGGTTVLDGTSGVDGEAVLTLDRGDLPQRSLKIYPSFAGDNVRFAFGGLSAPSVNFIGGNGYNFDNGIDVTNGSALSTIPNIVGQTLIYAAAPFFDAAPSIYGAVKISNNATTIAASGFNAGINGTESVNLNTYAGVFNNASTVSGTGINYGIFVTGNNSYFSGNVGIGTTSPYSMLSVAGQVAAANYVGTSTAASTFGGNVGIGSSTPYAQLSVAAPAGKDLFVIGSSTNAFIIDKNENATFAGSVSFPAQMQCTGGVFCQLQSNGTDIDFKATNSSNSDVFTVASTDVLKVSNYGLTLGGGTPTMGTCGSSPSVSGNDNTGKVTVGSGVVTSCTVNFGTTKTGTPHVFVSVDGATAIASSISAESTTAFTVNFASTLGGGTFDYFVVMN